MVGKGTERLGRAAGDWDPLLFTRSEAPISTRPISASTARGLRGVFFPGIPGGREDQRHYELAAGAHRPELVADGKPADFAEQIPAGGNHG